jgi:AraC-like DNA-binding protein
MSFIGADATVVNRELIEVNNFIVGEALEVSVPESGLPEDTGMLYLYPIDDNKYCLQLYFHIQPEGTQVNTLVCSLRFLPGFFEQYPAEKLLANQPFRFDQTTEQQFPVCGQARALIAKLREGVQLTPLIQALQQTETAMHLLRRALECITVPFTTCQVPACRFLGHESEREKIYDARAILEQNIDQNLTIKELARKVAMNECYLKKGFKAITGRTIHEYQQELRVEKAKDLLRREGRSVTEVANMLGYSSISHFSTAFKRATGMKPCELLA